MDFMYTRADRQVQTKGKATVKSASALQPHLSGSFAVI